jgi:hypothetical protein
MGPHTGHTPCMPVMASLMRMCLEVMKMLAAYQRSPCTETCSYPTRMEDFCCKFSTKHLDCHENHRCWQSIVDGFNHGWAGGCKKSRTQIRYSSLGHLTAPYSPYSPCQHILQTLHILHILHTLRMPHILHIPRRWGALMPTDELHGLQGED